MERERALEIVKKHYSPDGVDGTLRRALETLIPELTESEEEKIRKWLIEECQKVIDMANPAYDTHKAKEAIAWLEKQKDIDKMIVVSPEVWDNAINEAFENGKKESEKQKEQKSLNISAASEWLMEHVGTYMNSEYNEFHKCVEYDGGIDKERLINDFEEAMQKEQKPAEYLDKDKVYAIMTKLTNLSYSQLIPINSNEFKKLHEITSEVRSLLDYPIEQKPAEWSEEDEGSAKGILPYQEQGCPADEQRSGKAG